MNHQILFSKNDFDDFNMNSDPEVGQSAMFMNQLASFEWNSLFSGGNQHKLLRTRFSTNTTGRKHQVCCRAAVSLQSGSPAYDSLNIDQSSLNTASMDSHSETDFTDNL